VDVGDAVRAALATAGGAERAAGAPEGEPGELTAQAAATLAGWLVAAPEPAAAAWAAAHKARRPRRVLPDLRGIIAEHPIRVLPALLCSVR